MPHRIKSMEEVIDAQNRKMAAFLERLIGSIPGWFALPFLGKVQAEARLHAAMIEWRIATFPVSLPDDIDGGGWFRPW